LHTPSVSDENGDGYVSMAEAFNYASGNDNIEIPQYDDNGDTIGHVDPLPNGGDGILGSNLYIGGEPEPPVCGDGICNGDETLYFAPRIVNLAAR